MALFGVILKLGLSNGLITLSLFFLLLLALVVFVHRTFYKRSDHFMKLARQFPGPKPYPLIGTAYIFGADPSDALRTMADLGKEFETVSAHWIGPVFYVTIKQAHDVAVILSSNTLVDKTMAYDFMKGGIGEGLIASSGEIWRSHRRFLNPTFSNNVMEGYVAVFYSKMRKMAEIMEPHVDKPETNIGPLVQNCIFDILCETMISTKSDIQNSAGKQIQFLTSVILCVKIIHSRLYKPWFYIDFIFNKSTSGKQFTTNMAYLHDYIKEAIFKRREVIEMEKSLIQSEQERADRKKGTFFLDYMLKYGAKSNFNDKDILDETCNNMFGGFDSVAFATSAMLYILSKRFDIQEKIVEEIIEVFGSLEDKPYTYKDLESLKYINRVAKETLRLFSPVPFVARQITEETKIPSGYTLPKDSAVIVMILSIHRDPNLYPNPNVFDPDHFLPDRAAARPAYSYCPFSVGPRNCIGQKFAMLEIKAATVSLLRKYWLTPVDKPLKLANKINLYTTNGYTVGFAKRTPDRPQIKDYERLSRTCLTNIEAYNVEFKESYL